MTIEEYVARFWVDPEEAIFALLREQRPYYFSARELGRTVEAESKSRYPGDHVSEVTVTFWISRAFGKGKKMARTPNLRNGIRVFRILLDLKAKNEGKQGPE